MNFSYLKFLFLSPKGRITRREWVACFLLPIVLGAILGVLEQLHGREPAPFLTDWIGLVLLWPSICVQAKRLHDIGKSGWFQSIQFLPILLTSFPLLPIAVVGLINLICIVQLFAWMTRRGDEGENCFGPPSERPDYKGNSLRYWLFGGAIGFPIVISAAVFFMGDLLSSHFDTLQQSLNSVQPPVNQILQPPQHEALAGQGKESKDAFGDITNITKGKSRITLKATQASWIQVMDTQLNVLYRKVLRPGEQYPVPDQPGLTLDTANAGGLDIIVDGKQVQPIGKAGQIVRGVALDPQKMLTQPDKR